MPKLSVIFIILAVVFFLLVPNDFAFNISELPVNRGTLTLISAILAVVLFIKERAEADEKASKKPKHTGVGKKMKAVIITKYGGNDNIVLSSDKISLPRLKQRSDVLVRVIAASLNPVDLSVSEGCGKEMYNRLRMAKGEPAGDGEEFPLVPGHDVSGVVVKIGKDVKKVKIGDEVWASIPVWRSEGTLAEYVIINEYEISIKPSNLSHIEAASLPYAALSVWTSLVKSMILNAKKTKGKRVLILGGTGGVGSFAIQLVKAWGGHVTTTCSMRGVELVKRLGANEVVDYTKEDFETVLQDKQRFDVVLDTQGPQCYQSCLNLCASGGHVVTLVTPLESMIDKYGLIWGATKANWARLRIGMKQCHQENRCTTSSSVANSSSGSSDDLSYATGPIRKNGHIFHKSLTKDKLFNNRSFSWGIYAPDGEALDKIRKLVDAGKIKPVVEETFQLDDGVSAFKRLASGHRRGKLVINVDSR